MSRLILAAALVAGAVAPGCKGNVNDDSVALANTSRVSLGTGAVQGNNDCEIEHVSISSNGRFIAFSTDASNLTPNDTNGALDVFVRDMDAGATTCVSRNLAGTGTGNGESRRPSISGDGVWVAFESTATNMHPDDVDAISDIVVINTQDGTRLLASRATGAVGPKGDGASIKVVISADAAFVAFQTFADNLDGVDGGGIDNDVLADVYRRALTAANGFATTIVSVDSAGVKSTGPGPETNRQPTISDTGRFVGWESDATNLVPTSPDGGPDTNANTDVFRRDMLTNTTIRVSIAVITPPNPNGRSEHAEISGDGDTFVFRSTATNLHPSDDGAEPDIFARIISTSTNAIISVHSSGAQAGSSCHHCNVTADGRFIVFESQSTNLVNGDGNSADDCFIHDRATGVTSRLSVATFGNEANGKSHRPRISRDGQFVAFVTLATNLADDDTNGANDVYRRGPLR